MKTLRSTVLSTSALSAIFAHAFPDALERRSPASEACSSFEQNYPNLTSFPNQTMYVEENTEFWTSASWLGPACVFAPESAEQMSMAVKTLKKFQSPFAIRGGGHMPIGGAANIDSSGVLLATSGLSQLSLSLDQKSVNIGPGNRWGDVYKYLEPTGLVVVGGRMGVVGVPGFLLGGGISFFSNEYGWSSDNMVSLTCVLANGDIVKATASNQYPDLFWALKGGGNSFALVTNFELKTYEAAKVTVGQSAYGSGIANMFLDSVYNFALNGSSDSKTAIIPIVRWGPSQGETTYNAMRFYNGNDTSPVAMTNFSAPAMTALNDTFSYRSMYEWTKESDYGIDQVHGFRQKFHVVSLYADREAMQIVHDTYLAMAQAGFSNVTNFFTGVAFMPIAEQYILAGNAKGGDPQGVDASRAPYIWVEESISYTDPADDARIDKFLVNVNAEIMKKLEAQNIKTSPYLYLNDADTG